MAAPASLLDKGLLQPFEVACGRGASVDPTEATLSRTLGAT